jgi:hypothetical protein
MPLVLNLGQWHTPAFVKLVLPPRQSRVISQRISANLSHHRITNLDLDLDVLLDVDLDPNLPAWEDVQVEVQIQDNVQVCDARMI